MASRFIISLAAFSLTFSLPAFSEQFSVSEENLHREYLTDDGEASETSEPSRTAAAPQKNSEQKPAAKTEQTVISPDQLKVKPHYAGVRKPQPKPKKKSSKVKNEWFSSKTHPKKDRKGATTTENEAETPADLPEDRPFYIRNDSLTAQNESHVPVKNRQPLFASAPPAPQQQPLQEGQIYPETGFQAPRGHMYVTADYLYWRTRQEGMEYATGKSLKFEFNSGFRVGLGVHMPHDGWDIYVNYTHFYPEHSHSAHGSFYPLFLFEGTGLPDSQGPIVSEAHVKWNIEFQSVDVEIGRAYYIAKTLTFRPFIGLKGAWIDQLAKIHYEGGFIPAGQAFRTHFENDFKAAGPLLGIESNWQLGAGFSLFGDIAAALMVGHFDNDQEQHQLNNSEVVHLPSSFNLVSPTLQMIAGLAWDHNFHRDACHVGFSAGFETQYWWSQNQIEQFTSSSMPIYVREKGDLAFYGLTLRGRFDF